MPDYAVFGGSLRCRLKLEGVPTMSPTAAPDWRLRVARDPAPPVFGNPEAEDGDADFPVRLYRLRNGWRLEYSDTGIYDVAAGGRITWYPAAGALPELVQADILGRVLALSLVIPGSLPLHGSAVAVSGESIVLLGGKHHGKSTLAAALTAAGARLVSDDMAVVEPVRPVLLRPGFPQLRLWADSAENALADIPATRSGGVKNTLSGLPPERVETEPTRLRAIYLLDPGVTGPEGDIVSRIPLTPTEGVLILMAHTKLGALLRGALAAGHLRLAAEVVRQVPVYRLGVVRDLNRLPDVATRILGWYGWAPRACLDATS